jgi:hypothetical protein
MERINSFTLEKFRTTRRLTFLLDTLTQNTALLDDPAVVLRAMSGFADNLNFFIQDHRVREQ